MLIWLVTAPQLCLAAGHPQSDAEAARELFGLVNNERSRQGLEPLQWDDRLAEAALAHARLVVAHKKLSHQYSGEPALNLRLARTNIRLNRSGENLALDASARSAHEALINSPPHRANILSRNYNAIGIAAIWAGEDLYVVQDFAHRLPEESPGEFRDQVASEFARLRSASGVAPLKRIDLSYLNKSACEMAQRDNVDAQISAPGARFIITFTATEPQMLPADVTRFRSDNEVASYGIGSCFARTQTYPNGVYWVVMALFPKSARGN